MPGARPEGRFPAGERVKKRLEFRAAQDDGRRSTTAHFILLVYARDKPGTARLGIVASRKVGPAVIRNRAKRLVREAFRATRDLWTPGIDLVVIVRKPLVGMKVADVASEWRSVARFLEKRSLEAGRDRDARIATGATEAASP